MKVVYRNTLDDIIALQKMVLRHSRMGRKIMLHRFILVEVILFLICLPLMFAGNPMKIMLFFLVISIVAWIFRERSVILQFKKDMKGQLMRDPDAAFRKETTVRLSEKGLSVTNTGITTDHPWNRLEHFAQDSRYIYILTDGLRNYVIPKTAFPSDAEAETFLGALKDRRRGSEESV